jgi:hypothetical protein
MGRSHLCLLQSKNAGLDCSRELLEDLFTDLISILIVVLIVVVFVRSSAPLCLGLLLINGSRRSCFYLGLRGGLRDLCGFLHIVMDVNGGREGTGSRWEKIGRRP